MGDPSPLVQWENTMTLPADSVLDIQPRERAIVATATTHESWLQFQQQPRVLNVVPLTGLQKLFVIRPSVDDALQQL